MSIVTNFMAVPNRIAIGCEYLQFVGNAGASSEDFERALSPLKVRDEQGGTSIATGVLKELEDLGLASAGEDGNIRLSEAPGTQRRHFASWHDFLVPYILRLLVFPDVAADHRQRNVPEAIAWLLCQDSTRPVRSGEHAELLAKQFEPGDFEVNLDNDSRFQNLVYWCTYLGFCESFASPGDRTGRCVADPTRAIRRALPEVFDRMGRLPIETFVTELAERLPVLENGDVRESVERRLRSEYQRRERHFSQSTSLALRRLELAGDIRLLQLSDAPAWLRVSGAETATVSHI